jgi:biotin transporter BioY
MSSFFLKIDDKYETYTSADGASLLGLGYMLLFPIVNLLISYNVQKSNDLNNKENLVLFSLSMFPIIYAIATLSGLQIVVARYVNVFFIVWVITAFKNIGNRNKIIILFAYLIIAISSKYGMSIYNYNSSIEDNEIVKIALIWQSKGK